MINVSRNYNETHCLPYDEGELSCHCTCSSLQEALHLAGTRQDKNCTEILLFPGQEYSICRPTTINSSLVMRSSNSSSRVQVYISAKRTLSNQEDPFYVLSLEHSDYVRIEQIEFLNSSGIINIQKVETVVISDCVFRYFVEGALDIYDCPVVVIVECEFEHNGPVENIIKQEQFRSHSGAISIGCHNITYYDVSPNITVQECVFVNNSAMPNEELFVTSSELFQSNRFTGRGGALGLQLIESSKNITVVVTNCKFIDSSALSFGGAVYIIYGIESAHMVTVTHCMFIRNCAKTGGGGLFGGFLGRGQYTAYSFLNVSHCVFQENNAERGGGSFISRTGSAGDNTIPFENYVRFEFCTFKSNIAHGFASALSFATADLFRSRERDKSLEIANCNFTDNVNRESTTVGIAFISVDFEGHTIFDGSIGVAIQLAGSLVTLNGRLDIINTDVTGNYYGALYFTSLSQLKMYKDSDVYFYNNNGSVGAAITVEVTNGYETLARQRYNPLCFLTYESESVPPDQWMDVGLHFDGNSANFASVGFFDSLDACSWVQNYEPWFDNRRVLRWDFVDLGENVNHFHENDPTNASFYVQTSFYSLKVDRISAYPGETISFKVNAEDQLLNPVGSFIQLRPNPSENEDVTFTISPAVELYNKISKTIDVVIYIKNEFEILNNSLNVSIQAEDFQQQIDVERIFHLHLEICPPGYSLTPLSNDSTVSRHCQCNFDNSDVLECRGKSITLKEGLWATTDNNSEVDRLFTHPCLAGYCVSLFDSENLDSQCTSDRSGVLCGNCKNGTGMSALLNKCLACNNVNALSIPLLVLAEGGVIILFMSVLKAPLPGWLYPCLFYIQFLPYALELLRIQVIRRRLYLLASGLSLYYPYDICLYDSASSLASYSLRFVPLLVDLLVFPISMLVTHRYMKRHYLITSNSIWIVVVLQYTHTVHSAMMVLRCPYIPVNGISQSRWLVDGEVECFTGWHIPLALLAVIVLLFCVAVIPFTLWLIFIQDTSMISCIMRLRKPLIYGLKPQYKWWCSADLLRRLLLLLVILLSRGIVQPAFFTLCIITTVFAYIQPYKSSFANALEVIFSVDAILLFLVSIPGLLESDTQCNLTNTIQCATPENQTFAFVDYNYAKILLSYFPFIITVLIIIVLTAYSIWKKMYRHITRDTKDQITGTTTKSTSTLNHQRPEVTRSSLVLSGIHTQFDDMITERSKSEEMDQQHKSMVLKEMDEQLLTPKFFTDINEQKESFMSTSPVEIDNHQQTSMSLNEVAELHATPKLLNDPNEQHQKSTCIFLHHIDEQQQNSMSLTKIDEHAWNFSFPTEMGEQQQDHAVLYLNQMDVQQQSPKSMSSTEMEHLSTSRQQTDKICPIEDATL